MPSSELNEKQRTMLLEVARASIEHGLSHGTPLKVSAEDYPEPLREKGASFVTLHVAGHLRGCIGTLEAIRPLVEDVAHNAFAAAFRDPRFPPLSWEELPLLDIHISVLGPPSPLAFESEEDLIRQLRPGIDGLILEEGPFRGTFLPAVWEQLPEPETFLQHLKVKAGLHPEYWSDGLKVSRYTVDSIP